MTDHTNIDPGPSATVPVATDTDGSGDVWQRVKVGVGVDGSPADVSTGNPMPVVQTGTPALPTGAATETSVFATAAAAGATADAAYVSGSGTIVAILKGIFGKLPALVSGRVPVDGSAVTQPVSGTVTANIGTAGTLATEATQTAQSALYGTVTESAPATDTASSGLNGRLQRISQRLTTLLAGGLPAALGANGGLKIEGVASGTTVPVDSELTTADLDTGAGTDTRAVVGLALAASGGATIISAANPLPVTGGTSATQFAEDAAHASGDAGTMALGVRKDVAAALAGTDGDYQPAIFDASGRMHVNVGASALPTGAALDASVTAQSTLVGAVTETAPGTDTASSGLNGRLQRIAQRLTSLITLLPTSLGQKTMANGLAVTIASDQSVVPVSDNAGSLTVDNGGTFATQDSQKVADNAGFTDGTTPVQPAGFIFDEVAGTALTENDIGAARMDSKRAGVSVIEDATTRGQRLSVSAAGAAKVDGSAVTQPVSAASLPLPTGAATETTLAAQTKVDNAGFTDGTTPVSPVGYIFDEVAGTALTENDVAAARIDSKRAQVAVLEDGTTRGQRAAVSAAGRLSVDASGVAVPVTDNSGSLTVDAPVGTPVFVRLSSGAAAVDTIPTEQTPGTAGGYTTSRTLSAASTNATSVKASAGKVFGWYLYNANAAVRYLKLYNKASAPTVGTDTPTQTIPIPPGAGANVEFVGGIGGFTNGIALALTTGVADADTGAVAANEIIVNLFYK